MSYPNPWLFDGKPFDTEDIGKFEGFVYLIVNKLDGRKYIGRKYFKSIRKVKGKTRRQSSESDWKKYYGSSDDLKEDVKSFGEENFERHIISLHKTRGDCNYEEIKQQFLHNVLEDETYYNNNINSKWFEKPRHIVEARKYSKLVLDIRNESR